MRIITYCIALAMWMISIAASQAQETSIEKLESLKEVIINEEKDLLKEEVSTIQQQLDSGEITDTQAEQLKKEAAEKHALNIENRIAIIDNKIALLERNNTVEVLDDDDRTVVSISLGKSEENNIFYLGKKYHEPKYDRRTTSDLVFAFGLYNTIGDGQSLNDTDFEIGGSRFSEFGWAWNTRVFKESNWLRIKYGFSFEFNGIKPTDNRYFVDTGDQTELQEFEGNLDKSKFRLDNLVFPVHFELGPSRKIEKKNYFRYSTSNQFKVGLGGYFGFNLSSRQKLKYENEEGDVKEKLKGDYNTNKIIYGLSTYIGWGDTALYLKYELNTMFKNNTTDLHGVSLGLRFDMD
jgi:hypothetical protein